MNAEDLFWLAINAYHEARGEEDAGVKAVCHVVLNRCKKRKRSVKDVVLQPYQFSWANDGARPAVKEYEALQRCIELAMETCKEQLVGKTLSNADHYFAEYITPPVWAKEMTKITKIGKHTFFRA